MLRFISIVCFIILVSFSSAKIVLAASSNSPWISTPEQIASELQNGNASLSNFNIALFSNLMSTATIATLGYRKCPINQSTCYYEGGAVSKINSIASDLYQSKPASSYIYLADIGKNLNLIKPAYAQGLGFTSFIPTLELWKTFRNVAYIFYTIIFSFVGLMIMFRKKIDPRTVVTFQEALPRIIISLILVTFSYAIGGLIIDLGDFATRLIGGIFSPWIAQKGGVFDITVLNNLLEARVFDLVSPLTSLGALADEFDKIKITGLEAIDWLGAVTFKTIFAISGFFVMFRIFFALLTPFVTLVLQIIISPILLMTSALPSSKNNVTTWLKGLISNVAVFPVTFALLAISAIVRGEQNLWYVKPGDVTANWAPAALGRSWSGSVNLLLSFGILFTIPKVADMIKEALEYKPQSWEGVGFGREFGESAGKLPVVGGLVGGMVK